MEDAPVLYGINQSTRSLCAVEGDRKHHRFLTGTLSLNEANEVMLLEYDELDARISCRRRFEHEGEIWHIASCPASARHFATISTLGTGKVARLWEAAEEGGVADDGVPAPEAIKLLGTFGSEDGGDRVQKVLWRPPDMDDAHDLEDYDADGGGEEGGERGAGGAPCVLAGSLEDTQAVAVCEAHVAVHQVTSAGIEETGRMVAPDGGGDRFGPGSWDPHHPVQISVGQGGDVVGFDLRSQCEIRRIPGAHGACVRDVDYNPNKPWFLLSCGDDGTSKFWDLRRGGDTPVMTLRSHKHWVWRARYNRDHDQLVVTSSTDSNVDLWRVSTISSVPLLDADDEAGQAGKRDRGRDALLAKLDSHEDSVYGLAWSASDPWVFASLSYDGRVVVNTVPTAEKYKILL